MPPQTVHVQLLPRFHNYSWHPKTPREKWIQVLSQFVLYEVIKARDDAEEKEGFIASKALDAAAELWCHSHSSRYLVERVVCKDFSFCEYRDCYLVPESMPAFKRILRLTPESFKFVRKMIEMHPVFEHKGKRRQLKVEVQLKIALMCLGYDGSLTSFDAIAGMMGVSEGSVKEYTDRV
ncbi:hypothetical protein BGZ59_002067, partial [Podila verticillata]